MKFNNFKTSFNLVVLFILLLPKLCFAQVFSDSFNDGVIDNTKWHNPLVYSLNVSENINIGFLSIYGQNTLTSGQTASAYLPSLYKIDTSNAFDIEFYVNITNSTITSYIEGAESTGGGVYLKDTDPSNPTFLSQPNFFYSLRKSPSDGYYLIARLGYTGYQLGQVSQGYGTLKLTYDGFGNWSFYFDDGTGPILKGTYSYTPSAFLYYSLYADAGAGAGGATFNVDTRFDFITTTGNLIFPSVLTQSHLSNSTRPGAPDIQLGEQYKLTATGTPNQINVQGTIGNADRIGQPNSEIGTRFTLAETPAGSGNYEYTGTLTTTIDNGGFVATKIAGAVSIDNFTGVVVIAPEQLTITSPVPPPTIISINPNTGENTATISTTITGTNFQNGISAKLQKSGQLDINGVVIFINSSAIKVNFNLTSVVTGSWDVVVTNPDGQTASLINGFTVTSPPTGQITSANFSNFTRPGATDIDIGEQFKVIATGTPNQINVTGVIANSNRLGQLDAIIGAQFPLTENPAGSGNYEYIGTFTTATDNGGNAVSKLAGAASNDNFTSNIVIAPERLTVVGAPAPQITSAHLYNTTRLGATDIQIGENFKITATGDANQLNITGVIANANRLGAPDAIVGVPFNIVETPVGSGNYEYSGVFTTAIDNGGFTAIKIAGVVTNDNFASVVVITSEQLTIPPPTLISINPNTSENTGVILTTITGSNFKNGITAKLQKAGQPDINGVVTFIDAITIQASFDLTGVVTGTWNVVVTNPDGQNASLVNGFTVTSPPVQIFSAQLTNFTRLGAPDINIGEQYKITATGTTNQSNIIGVIANANRIGSPDAIIGAPFNLVETPAASGNYEYTGTLTTAVDNGGWTATKIVGAVTNDNFASVVITLEQLTVNFITPPPTIISIVPNTGPNTGTISTTITGSNFQNGITAKLKRSGQPDINGVVTFIDSSTIQANFDLTNVAGGNWDVAVINPDTQAAILTNGFTITSPLAQINTAHLYNNTRLGATDIAIGENFKVTVTGDPNQTNIILYIANVDRLGQPDANIGMPIDLVETPLGSGNYECTGTLTTDKDAGNNTATKIIGAVSNDNFTSNIIITPEQLTIIAVAQPPTIISINPNTGENTGIITTTITGTNFQNGISAKLQKVGQSDITGTVTFIDASHIQVNFNLTGVSAGNWDVVVTNPDLQTANLPNGFTVTLPPIPPPTIISITPNNGENTGIISTTITGTNFQNGITAKLQKAGQSDINGVVTFINSTTIKISFNLVGAVAGGWDVIVVNPDLQTATLPNGFMITTTILSPAITSINPSIGANTGVISTTITGANFQNGITAKLQKVGQPDINGAVTFINSTTIKANFDLTGVLTGFWNVMVINPDGQIGLLTNGFTITIPPTNISINPNTGANGGVISTTITGNNFQNGVTAKLTKAGESIVGTNIVYIDSTTIKVDFDLTNVSIGPWNVVVINPDLQTGTLYDGFLVQAIPKITAITPDNGYNTGSLYVNITGRDFSNAAVKLQLSGNPDVDCLNVASLPNQITCKFDLNGVIPGIYDVVVTNSNNLLNVLPNGFKVNVPPTTLPVILSIVPSSYPINDIANVTVKGYNFKTGLNAKIERTGSTNIDCQNVYLFDSTEFTCSLIIGPSTPTGLYDVVVINPDNQMGTLPLGFHLYNNNVDIELLKYVRGYLNNTCGGTTLLVENRGWTKAKNITVTDFLPPNAIFCVDYNPNQGIYDPINNTVTWQVPYINGTETLRLDVGLRLPYPWGVKLVNTATVTAYDDNGNLVSDIATAGATVHGAFDPNYKDSYPQGFINNNQTINYFVEFENEGDAPAINIKVTDTLDENLEPATFEYISDNGKYDPDTRTITWQFNNINLPPKGTGFITYALKPKADLPIGTQIKNKALVYFDFNPAVETPEVVNTIGDPNAVKSQDLTLEILLLKQRISALDITNKQGFIAKLDAAYSKLQSAIENIQANKKELAEKNIETAINELEALKNLIKAQEGKKLSKQLAQELKEQTESIIEQIGNLKENLEGNEIAEIEKKDKALNIFEVSKVLLLPNPITSTNLNQKEKIKLLVDATGQINSAKIEIYTSSGKKVSAEELLASQQGNGKFKFSSPNLDASISTLPNGIYFYRVVLSDGVNEVSKVGKIVILK